MTPLFRFVRLLALSCLAILAVGCASIVSGTSQVVSVDTPGCPRAACELTNDKGRFFVQSTPGTVTLSRSYADLVVSCTRDGANPVTQNVPSTTKGMAFGNILFGGVIGAGVDMASGAAYDYPQSISVAMQCHASSATSQRAQVAAGANLAAAPAVAAGPSVQANLVTTEVPRTQAGQTISVVPGTVVSSGLSTAIDPRSSSETEAQQSPRVALARDLPPVRLGIDVARLEAGLRILKVERNSLSDFAGLKAGDVIVRSNGVPIRSPDDMLVQVAKQRPTGILSLTIIRDGFEAEVKVALAEKTSL